MDFSPALTARTELLGFADAAALGAISEGSPSYKAIQAMTSDGEIEVAEKDGKKIFLSQRAGAGAYTLTEVYLNVAMKVTRKNGAVTSVATFSAEVPTTFMRVLGGISCQSQAPRQRWPAAKRKATPDFYMLLDNTPSMGTAGTREESSRVERRDLADLCRSQGCRSSD
jgi:hypothetical protein